MDQPQTTPAPPAKPPASKVDAVKQEFVCDPRYCQGTNRFQFGIGRTVASSLSGFIAGVIVASIVFVPWLLFLSKLCTVNNS